jgi:hypothetical protein
MYCKYCVFMYVKGKMRPVETIPGMGGGRIKENDGGGEFKRIFRYIITTFVNATMCSH